MHQVCRRSFLLLLVVLCIFVETGCTKHSVDSTINYGEWISLINEKAGIYDYTEKKPYFINISANSPYFDDIQSAVEWGILDKNHSVDVERPLTRELAAYTLINLSGVELVKETGKYRDIQNTQYPKEVTTAITLGLLEVDKKNRFRPKEIVDKEEALNLLDVVTSYINGFEYDNDSEITINDDLDLVDEVPESYDLDEKKVIYPADSDIKEDQYLKIESNIYKIKSVEDNEENTLVTVEEAELTDVYDSFVIQGHDELDFSNAEIIEEYPSVIEETSFVEPTNIKLMSIQSLKKTFDYNGVNVLWRLTSSGIYAEISKKNKSGAKAYANFTLNKVKPTYQWVMKDGKIKHAYFRIDFETSEKTGFINEKSQTKYGNFNNLYGNDFISLCQNFFQSERSITEVEVPIAKLKIPLASNPGLSVKIELRLKLYATGKAEISFIQENTVGMEIKNNHMRIIQESKPDAEALVKASIGSSANLLFGLNAMNLTLANTGVEAGIEASLKGIVHEYDEYGDLNSTTVDIPYDILEEAFSHNEGILVCADLENQWILNANFNTSASLAGRFGFSKKVNILNGPFLNFEKSHFENGQFMKSCSRKSRNHTSVSKTDPLETSQIRIQTYAITLLEGRSKSLTIKGLPRGYALKDIVFTSSNTSIATVDEVGKITALKEGSARITCETYDGKYSVYCSVLVQKEK